MSKKKRVSIFEIFSGERVSMYLNFSIEASETTEDTVSSTRGPLSVEGYLTDEDDEFYYLGIEPAQYNVAVRKTNVMGVFVSPEESIIPETSPEPKKDNKGVH